MTACAQAALESVCKHYTLTAEHAGFVARGTERETREGWYGDAREMNSNVSRTRFWHRQGTPDQLHSMISLRSHGGHQRLAKGSDPDTATARSRPTAIPQPLLREALLLRRDGRPQNSAHRTPPTLTTRHERPISTA